jgi:hypothetical protein
MLIDLQAQPDYLKEQFDACISDTVNTPVKRDIGFHLLKFANQWGLVRIEQHASDYTPCLSKAYTGALKLPTS